MSRIIVDEVLRSKLKNLGEPLELCDPSGQVLAHLIPKLNPVEFDLQPRISPDEIRRRMQSDEKTYTTAEVLAHLQSL